jgi:hypothetical protein
LNVSLLLALAAAPTVAAQESTSTVIAAGPAYGAGAIKGFLFGRDYRAMWTAPVRVPYLDLATMAGGLTPTTAGGGVQTKSLRFTGADGYDYGFRSVDKSLGNMPAALVGTFVEGLALDQTSAQHPAAPGIVTPLAEAAGLLHTDPILVVLPDDPRLGPHRERFKHTLGYFERRATIPEGAPPFAGAREIIGSDELLRRIRAAPDDRVDVRTFLKARLFDLLIGDRDRHRGQWTWARLDEVVPRRWVPIPEDRDQAFVRFDGFVLWGARRVTGQLVHFEAGELLNFEAAYGRIVGATWSGRELDRLLLVGLERPIWDSIVADLQARITDAAIDTAAARMPEPYRALDGGLLAQRLRSRRDRLPAFAERFYRLLAQEVEVHGTDRADLVVVDRGSDDTVHVRVTQRERPDAPFWERRFAGAETDELRVFLHGGADSVILRGPGSSVAVHIVGAGNDVVVDSSGVGRVRLYSPAATDRAVGPRSVAVDRRPYRPPHGDDVAPPRDWGHQWDPSLTLGFAPDLGLVVVGGPRYTSYGFWKYPFAHAVQLRVGFATTPKVPTADLRISAYRRNSRVRGDLSLRASGLAMVRFHGLGNDLALTESDDYYRVNQRQFELSASLSLPLGEHGAVRFGPTGSYHRTVEQEGRIIEATRPVGSGRFGQIGVAAAAEVGGPVLAFDAGVRAFPPAWDVDSGFVSARAQATAHLAGRRLPLHPVLALRAGGKSVWGPYPFHEAAYLGDAETVRLGRQNRFGGDAAVWGNAELRLRIGAHRLLLPGELGVMALADGGRVFLEGESSDTWHTAWGGGVWLSVLDPNNVLTLQIVRTAERTAAYFRFGFPF